MKKIILYLIMATSILGAQLVDGEYSVKGKEYYYGWLSTTSIEVEDGKIVKIITDKINENGALATNDKKYNKDMKDKTGVSFEEFSVKGPKNLMKAFNKNKETKNTPTKTIKNYLPKVDMVAGATHSSKEFEKMMEFLVKKAQSGDVGDYSIKL